MMILPGISSDDKYGFGVAKNDFETTSEYGKIKANTVQDFFQIEQENEELRSQLYEIQSNFTA